MKCRVVARCYLNTFLGQEVPIYYTRDEVVDWRLPQDPPACLLPLEGPAEGASAHTLSPRDAPLKNTVSQSSRPVVVSSGCSQLDPDNEDHWTSQGLPRLQALALVPGLGDVTRDEIKMFAPWCTREHMRGVIAEHQSRAGGGSK